MEYTTFAKLKINQSFRLVESETVFRKVARTLEGPFYALDESDGFIITVSTLH